MVIVVIIIIIIAGLAGWAYRTTRDTRLMPRLHEAVKTLSQVLVVCKVLMMPNQNISTAQADHNNKKKCQGLSLSSAPLPLPSLSPPPHRQVKLQSNEPTTDNQLSYSGFTSFSNSRSSPCQMRALYIRAPFLSLSTPSG